MQSTLDITKDDTGPTLEQQTLDPWRAWHPKPWCATEGETEGPSATWGRRGGGGGDSESAAAETVSLLYRWSCICNSPAHTLPALCSSNSGRVASVHSALCSFALFFLPNFVVHNCLGTLAKCWKSGLKHQLLWNAACDPPPPRRRRKNLAGEGQAAERTLLV